ncbi:MAG: DUF47 family protein [Magnetococcales bacterium]|nr:DUF47 family protein [Magnetococcales bacterium]
MSGSSNSLAVRLLNNVFPRMPDFYGMINEQCVVALEAMEAFVEFMETGNVEKSNLVRELEKKGDEIKARNMMMLNNAFATPMDREDIYRAISSIDMIMNYAKTTVREMEVLELGPDNYCREMAVLLRDGVDALKRGFGKLGTAPALAEEDCQTVNKTERNVEKCYRRAIADLFKADEALLHSLENSEPGAQAKAMLQVTSMFKRRELYRHMSNSADQLNRAGEILHDIVVQIS